MRRFLSNYFDLLLYYIIHAFITRASPVMILNQRCWQSLHVGRQHGKGVDGLFEKVSFQTAFERVESGCRTYVPSHLLKPDVKFAMNLPNELISSTTRCGI